MNKPGEKMYFADYSQFLNDRQAWINQDRLNPERFVGIHDRDDTTLLTSELFNAIEVGKYKTDWKGMGMSKDPLDLGILALMLWDVKPRTVIELGVLRGGSIVWLSDHVKLFNLKCKVIGFDIDYSHLHPDAKEVEGVTYLTGDCNKIEKTFTPDVLQKLPHPWIIIEDAHAYLHHVMGHFTNFMQTGDYFVVEDTNPATKENSNDVIRCGSGKYSDDTKLRLTRSFLEKHQDLKIDTFFTDRFGYLYEI